MAGKGREGKQALKEEKETTARARQKSLHVSFGIDLWEREDVWKWSWCDPWKSPNALRSVEGNLSAEKAVALPG